MQVILELLDAEVGKPTSIVVDMHWPPSPGR
jgi:hypothetical protein